MRVASLQELPYTTLTLTLKAMLIHRDCYTACLHMRLLSITLVQLTVTETKRCMFLAFGAVFELVTLRKLLSASNLL